MIAAAVRSLRECHVLFDCRIAIAGGRRFFKRFERVFDCIILEAIRAVEFLILQDYDAAEDV